MGKSIAYPLSPVNPHPHLRVIRDEEAPPYDGEPPTRAERGHVTVITDDVVEGVVAQCGMTGAGLYLLLERLVGKDGSWVCTVPSLAAKFGCSDRHVQETANRLEAAGFLQRTAVNGPRGMTVGNRWFLPHHRQAQESRTYRGEATGEVTGEPSCARQQEEVVTSKDDVGASRRESLWESFVEDYRSEKNKPGALGRFYELVIGATPEYGRIAKMLKESGSGEAVGRAILDAASHHHTDDPLDYVHAILKRRKAPNGAAPPGAITKRDGLTVDDVLGSWTTKKGGAS